MTETLRCSNLSKLLGAIRRLLLCAMLPVACTVPGRRAEPVIEADVVIYGCTSAGVVAAVQAKRMGKSVVVVGPDTHLGGLSAGGLGWTDSGDKSVVGGIAREFYQRIYHHYSHESAWRWQSRSDYGNRGQGAPAIDGDDRTMWIFEPHVAEQAFEDLIHEHGIPVYRDEWLRRDGGVIKDGSRIRSIEMLSGSRFVGSMFIDVTYEGDLMAAAGVSYAVGREANSQYGEQLNGVQADRARSHQFHKPVDPYVVAGDPTSGLLPRIHGEPPGKEGSGDHRVQAYCFRTCMTDHESNRVSWPKPESYDPRQYELALRYLQAGWKGVFNKFDPIPNRKTDTNNHGAFSFDNIGYNYDYPNGSYDRRREIIAEHEAYQKGLLWFLANDVRVPQDIRQEMSRWGLSADEFCDNGNWPHQIYVREARRMVSEWVQTEGHLRGAKATPRPIGMGSYNMDSHNVQRYVDNNGHARNEGDIQIYPGGPYAIDYGAIVPRKDECENLLVPVCLSSSHIAYGSIRMEPVFMILGESAATAAVLSIENQVAVQDLRYEVLESHLRSNGQVLQFKDERYTSLSDLSGVVIDDSEATLVGPWQHSTVAAGVHRGYLHDGNRSDNSCRAVFTADLDPGSYELQIAYTPHANRATNVPIRLTSSSEVHRFTLNQRRSPVGSDGFHLISALMLGGTTTVAIKNDDTNGYVVVDAVRFVRK